MKKANIVLISVILIVVLIVIMGLGGFLIWKLNDKIDSQRDEISKLNENIQNQSNNNENVTNNTNKNIVNSYITNEIAKNNTANSTVNNTTNSITNSTNNNTINNGTNNGNEEKKIKEALEKMLAQSKNYSQSRVDSVKVLTASEKQAVIAENKNGDYKNTDILAYVTYSIVPAENYSNTGTWQKKENLCVCYRDGQIISFGTKW